jgi:predicted nucleic acid-binding protein
VKLLVDTSVWSLALRRKPLVEHPSVRRLHSVLGKADVVLTGLVLQEVLQAFRVDATVRKVARHLSAFPLLQLDRRHYESAAAIHRLCAARGIATSTSDRQVASAAIEHGCALLTADDDFTRIAKPTTLRLLESRR